MKVDNAVIMAAGTSSRFAPLSHECHKGLIEVKGEIMIERQIRQMREVGISEIFVVVGYLSEQFKYLEEKFGVHLVMNSDYLRRNNNSSIYAVKDNLKNTYICSVDNYFSRNPFESEVAESYYAAVYADGPTKEWCIFPDGEDVIRRVEVGGSDAWYMLGHTFWDKTFSGKFVQILEETYDLPETANLLWESIYIRNIQNLTMKIRRYAPDVIFEFDTLDELRQFDISYETDTRSVILKGVAQQLGCREQDIRNVTAYSDETNEAAGFTFQWQNATYRYAYISNDVRKENVQN